MSEHKTEDPRFISEPGRISRGYIPFTWRLQPYEDELHWCRCQRCFAALRALEIHMLARSYV